MVGNFQFKMNNEINYIKRCLELSEKAKENGFSPVGALIVVADRIIAEAFEGEELPAVLAHAESIVIVKALTLLKTKKLSEATIYTNKEPCFMCSYLIRHTEIKKVVYLDTAGAVGGTNPDFPLLTTNNIANWKTNITVRKIKLE